MDSLTINLPNGSPAADGERDWITFFVKDDRLMIVVSDRELKDDIDDAAVQKAYIIPERVAHLAAKSIQNLFEEAEDEEDE